MGTDILLAIIRSYPSGNHTLDESIAFDRWNRNACEHEKGILSDHRLGNISLIASLQSLLTPYAEHLTILLENVIYDGTHCGDFLPVSKVEVLKSELRRLSAIHFADPEDEMYMREFELQLRELVDCALRVSKPIVF